MRSGGMVRPATKAAKAVGQSVGRIRMDQDFRTIVKNIGKFKSKPAANSSKFKEMAGKAGFRAPTMFASSAAGALGKNLPGPQLASAVLNALCSRGDFEKAGKVLKEIMFA